MESFDVLVVGAGSGLTIVDGAARMGLKVALVEEGPMGGTCLNRGCIPSKMLIHSGEVAETIANAAKFGITAKITKVDFRSIVSRVTRLVDKDAREIEEGIREDKNVTLFKMRGKFVGKKTMQLGTKKITADKVFVMGGTRTLIPPIEGLKEAGFITSTEALRLKEQPKVLTIAGGGYIAAELAHFFSSLGTKVNILQRAPLLVNREDEEIAAAYTKAAQKKYNVFLGYEVQKVQRKGKAYTVTAIRGKLKKSIKSDQLLLAVGRIPNSDILEVQNAGIKVNKFGYIETNDYLETSAADVWAGGDIAGKWLFKHSANLEAQYMFHNAFYPSEKMKVDYFPMPHAIFSSPQIAGVGSTEAELQKGNYAVGKYSYIHTGMGAAMQDDVGFVKILVDKNTRKILGCHIIGAEASTLIHEVVLAMKLGEGTVDNITKAVHVHPALPEVVQRAAASIEF